MIAVQMSGNAAEVRKVSGRGLQEGRCDLHCSRRYIHMKKMVEESENFRFSPISKSVLRDESH